MKVLILALCAVAVLGRPQGEVPQTPEKPPQVDVLEANQHGAVGYNKDVVVEVIYVEHLFFWKHEKLFISWYSNIYKL